MKEKKSFLVLTSGKFLEALVSGIGTGSIFCLSFLLSNRVVNLIKTIHVPNVVFTFGVTSYTLSLKPWRM